jgi:zinc D-Ala-D-Ala dipeptidase
MKIRLINLVAIYFLFSCAIAQNSPPVEAGHFRQPDLVELIKIDPALKLDIRYSTPNNFVGQPVYEEARAFLRRPAAESLVRAHQKANAKGYGFIIFDAYRPWHVTKLFWDRFPQVRKYLADPTNGSRHNRGCAVDLTLFDMKTGNEIQMPSGYDDFSERAHPNYEGGTADQRKARDLLRTLMESEGFSVYENEWWHFDCKNWHEYTIMNIRFSEIGK